VTVPGDKSITHRALLVGALARGSSTVAGANLGRDVLSTASVLGALGAPCRIDKSKGTVEVEGCGRRFHDPDNVLDAGNSGTTLRTLLGVLAPAPVAAALTGDDSLRRRPMLRVVEPLRALGAAIDGRAGGRFPPLWIRGSRLVGRHADLEVASAQVKTAILLAGLGAEGITSVTEPGPSRDHTERMLAASGIDVRREGRMVSVSGGQDPRPLQTSVPGDLSSALFLVVAALLVEGSDLEIDGVGLNPTRAGALEVLRAMGADLSVEMTGEQSGEPVGRIRARASELTGIEVEGSVVPRLIDEIPALAVAATQARGVTVVRGAEELRLKESDRIDALVAGLTGLGARIESRPDGLVVRGPGVLSGARVQGRGDHRIALALAVAGLIARDPVEVEGWDCVDVSFPEWDEVLAAAQERPR
jgi:3-phosphoshikimate 1-carboxyvinyltransferase